MLKIIRNWEKQDYLRTLQGFRGYGLQITNVITPMQIIGAYTSEERTIEYLFAHRIDDTTEIQDTYIIDTDRIKYADGQYLFDLTKDLGGYLDEGVYFYEFNDGYETYYSELFKAESINELFKCSGDWLCSTDELLSSLNINTNGFYERLKKFGEGSGFVEIAE